MDRNERSRSFGMSVHIRRNTQSPADRLPPALLPPRPSRAPAGLPAVRLRRPLPGGAGPLDRLAGPAPPAAGAGCAASPFPAVSLGARAMFGVEGPGTELAPAGRGLAAGPWSGPRSGRNLRQRPAQGNLLPSLELALSGTDSGTRCMGHGAREDAQGCFRVSAAAGLADGPARTNTPCALPLDARLLGHPQHRLSRPLAPPLLNAYVSLVGICCSESGFWTVRTVTQLFASGGI